MASIPQMPVLVTLKTIPEVFENYFGRVHKKYNDMNTTNIEKLVSRLLQDPDPTEETALRNTLLNRFIKAKTPLGEVLQELEDIQESPGRKLLSKEILIQAEKEAGELTKKEVTLATEKGGRKQLSNEVPAIGFGKIGSELQINTYTISRQQGQLVASLSRGRKQLSNEVPAIGFGKIGSEFQVNTYTISRQQEPSVTSLRNGKFVVTWMSDAQDGDWYGVFGQVFNADGTKNGSEFQINTNTISAQRDPSVAVLSNNSFVVTWERDNQDSSGWGVFGQIFKEVIPITSTTLSSTSFT